MSGNTRTSRLGSLGAMLGLLALMPPEKLPNSTSTHRRSSAKAQRAFIEAVGSAPLLWERNPFDQIVALVALTKSFSGTYMHGNGYTEGKH